MCEIVPDNNGYAAIWAQSADGVIGDGHTMPWYLPEDLAHFKKTTGSDTVVMGRHTWQSLPEQFRPLPGRRNIVLSTRPAGTWSDGAEVTTTLPEAPAWIMGGGKVYDSTINDCSLLVVTVIDADIKNLLGDNAVMAPVIPDDRFELVRETDPVESSRGHLLVGDTAAPLTFRIQWWKAEN
ncbi:dihydrofolate reductase [Corynebacterium mendelii]|uniref:dihydrofolate reductase n=1 Tax=Corynebacterium mendelii TaxID=2765362 RepID=A0A939E1E0_9CORY|nr:dihydrofolate reductase [Corynebacterium mendelii]MBN9644681.1 dihydrofolate reductase [Corynebacterium mendelii]